MLYSFTNIRKKHILSLEGKVLTSFFTFSTLLLISAYSFLKIQSYNYENDTYQTKQNIQETLANIELLNNKIKFVNRQIKKFNQINTKNLILKNSIKNLFNIVPPQVSLTKMHLKEKSLIIYGSSPSKEVYEFLLLAPLKAIFNKTKTNFYVLPNGWYKFVSKNYLDKKGRFGDE